MQLRSNDCYTLTLYDLAGQEVFNDSQKSITGDSLHNINLAGFDRGIYTMEIQGNGFTEYINFIIH